MLSTLNKLKKAGVPLRPMVSSTTGASSVSNMIKFRDYQTLTVNYRHRGVLSRHSPLNRSIPFQNPTYYQTRNAGMLVGRILRGALKIRYWLIGGAVGGGISLQKVGSIFIFSQISAYKAHSRCLLTFFLVQSYIKLNYNCSVEGSLSVTNGMFCLC